MKLITVVGARPQFIKASAVSRVISERAGRGGSQIAERIVHTGQHYDVAMSDVFFAELGIPAPHHHLGVGSGGHGVQTGEMMIRLEDIVLSEKPQALLVYGDTNSTLAGAVVAAKLHVPVVHVEAGLRSFDRTMPEEVNRVVADHVSDLLLCPSQTAVSNLAREGVVRGVHLVGDVMHDVLLSTSSSLNGAPSAVDHLGLVARRYVVVTIHRASTTDDPDRIHEVFDALNDIAEAGLDVVFPIHPRTRALADAWKFADRVRVIDPLGYRDMIGLVRQAHAVATDSGGLQKEAAWLGTPCVTLRDATEWVETIDEGWNILVGTERQKITERVISATRPALPFQAYGSGFAAPAVVDLLLDTFG
jgi:UDP-N-acetylglucosamine 2-epimerase